MATIILLTVYRWGWITGAGVYGKDYTVNCLYMGLHWILLVNIPDNILPSLFGCLTMSLHPHIFIKVARDVVTVATSHLLQLDLHPVPI